jgi:FkbM family methyltransferase
MASKARVGNRLLGLLLRILPQGLQRRIGVHLGAADIRWSLMQLRRFGFIPRHIMDVGAFRGDWTRISLDIFPEATITCIEPQDAPQEELKKLAGKHSNVKVIQTLLGRSKRENVPFREIGSGSSVLLNSGEETKRPMTTIDALIEEGYCKLPQLLKLDVQGYELEVLEGYTHDFDACKVIQCEISLLPIVQGAPHLHEVVNYLHRRGFVMFDVDELIRAEWTLQCAVNESGDRGHPGLQIRDKAQSPKQWVAFIVGSFLVLAQRALQYVGH